MVLCVNSRYDNNETLMRFEPIALDVKAGVEFLHRQPGITKVVLFGYSGGGSTMSFYQAVAENGPSYCRGPNKLSQCGEDLAGLPRADGIVFADAHPGEPVQIMRGLNPAFVEDKQTGKVRVIAALDPFSPANGYNPHGTSHYSGAFLSRYFKAQATRMNDLIDMSLAKLKKSKEAACRSATMTCCSSMAAAIPVRAMPAAPSCSSFDPDIQALKTTDAAAKAAEERRHRGDADRQQREGGLSRPGRGQSHLRSRHQDLHAAFLPQRLERHARHQLAGRHRFLLVEQRGRLRRKIDHRADHDGGDGRA